MSDYAYTGAGGPPPSGAGTLGCSTIVQTLPRRGLFRRRDTPKQTEEYKTLVQQFGLSDTMADQLYWPRASRSVLRFLIPNEPQRKVHILSARVTIRITRFNGTQENIDLTGCAVGFVVRRPPPGYHTPGCDMSVVVYNSGRGVRTHLWILDPGSVPDDAAPPEKRSFAFQARFLTQENDGYAPRGDILQILADEEQCQALGRDLQALDDIRRKLKGTAGKARR